MAQDQPTYPDGGADMDQPIQLMLALSVVHRYYEEQKSPEDPTSQ